MTRIAIIPARGGSKRIPNKNIRDFCGQPIISYVLDAARKSELFDAIHVSTDSKKIRSVVEELGYPVDFLRPLSLSDDYTPIMPVLKFVLEEYYSRGREFDQVCLLMATAPLIDDGDIKAAFTLFEEKGGKRPVMAVTPYPAPLEWAFKRIDDGYLEPLNPGMFSVRSQDLDEKYYDAGCLAIFPALRVMTAEGAGCDVGFYGFVLPKWKAVDIDKEEDWSFAESLFMSRRNLKTK